MQKITIIKEALRIFKRKIRVKKNGIKQYSGNPKQICKQIIEDCYNKEYHYFQVSNGHFCEFYCRDFGIVCKSLIDLGYKKQVKNTLIYALNTFRHNAAITTSINPKGKCFDFPYYAIDSLAFLLYSLSLINDKHLINEYRDFLDSEIIYLCHKAVDRTTGLVRSDKYFSSMKDYSKRKSSCYDNCMLYLIQQSCKKLGLVNPLKYYNYKQLILEHFWNGRFFIDDLSGKYYVAGDANIFPFWTGLITDKKILKKAIHAIETHSLDKPFPLRYTHENNKEVDIKAIEIFAKDYERHVVWTHMGPLYIKIVGKINKKLQKKYIQEYARMIQENKNYLEVFMPDKSPYQTFFYYSDEGMIWCANILKLLS